jgi:ribonuclease HI
MKRHKHAKLLETIVHHIRKSKDSIHLYKIAHAGILGNKCADAIAKCSAEIQVVMIFTLVLSSTPVNQCLQ